MKKYFPEYYALKPKEKELMWNSAVFVFDANVLLNLYRYSERTRKDFLRVLDKMNDQVWLPHQFALEYQRNRLEVIEEQVLSYEDVIRKLDTGLSQISSQINQYKHRHPFLNVEKILQKITSSVQNVKKQIELAKAKHPKWSEKDPIRDHLDKLFKDKVGAPCVDIEDIERRGAIRFAKKIPPGYEDAKKDKGDVSSTRKYGDWIAWYQIMEMAKEKLKPVILVTNDKKEDWWLQVKGKTVGPRPELIKEIFCKETPFHMYTMEEFLEYAKPIYNVRLAAVEEIEQVNKRIIEDSLGVDFTHMSDLLKLKPYQSFDTIIPPGSDEFEDAGEQTMI